MNEMKQLYYLLERDGKNIKLENLANKEIT